MTGMKEPAEIKSVLMEKNRMESLTDGIFAFAMTLLVTSMILPGDAVITRSSSSALLAMLPDFYHYIIAFFVLAAFWMGHHEQFSRVHHIDNNFLYLNIIALFFVTLVPFSTSFIGDYNADVTATCLFELNLMVLGLIFALQWWYATRRHHLIAPDYPESQIRRRLYHGLIIPFISLIGMIITVAGFDSSTMIYMTSPLASYVVNRYTGNGSTEG
jgi:TMEM175 potassium channel family protein